MLRIVIILVVVVALVVFLRLIILSFRQAGSHPGAGNTVINMPARVVQPLAIKDYRFESFDWHGGPPDPEHFDDRLVVAIGDPDSARIRCTATIRVATPAALQQRLDAASRSYSFSRGLLLVQRYDPDVIARALHDHVSELAALGD